MQLNTVTALMFITTSIWGATETLNNDFSIGVVYIIIMLFLFAITWMTNTKIQKAKDEIQGIKPILADLKVTMNAMNTIIDKISNTLENLQTEKMIYASKTQILNILKTNIDLCEMKVLNHSFDLKSRIGNVINSDPKNFPQYQENISNIIKLERNVVINNLKPFKYSQADIEELILLVFNTQDLTSIITNYLVSQKDNITFKIEVSTYFNDLYNKFSV